MASDMQRQFGRMLQERREVLGKSQTEIGNETFTSQKTVSSRETGRTAVPLEGLSDIAEAYQLRDVLSDVGTIYGVAPDMVPVVIDVTDRYEQLAQDYRALGMLRHANAIRYIMRHATGNPDTPGRIIDVMTLTRPEYEAVTELRRLFQHPFHPLKNTERPLDVYVRLLSDVMPSFDRGEEQNDTPFFEREEDNHADMHDIVCRYCPMSSWCPGNRVVAYGCHYDVPDETLGGHTKLECMEEIVRAYADRKMMIPDIPEQAIHHVPSVEDILDRAPQGFVESFPDELDPNLWPDALTPEDAHLEERDDGWGPDGQALSRIFSYDGDGTLVGKSAISHIGMSNEEEALKKAIEASIAQGHTVIVIPSWWDEVDLPQNQDQIDDMLNQDSDGVLFCVRTADGTPIMAWRSEDMPSVSQGSGLIWDYDDAVPVVSGDNSDWEVWNGRVTIDACL